MIRVTPDLYQLIEKEAREQKRSVSSQVSYIVERAMEPHKAEARG